MSKKTIWIITSILLVYYIFTSGFVFEVTKNKTINHFDIPYSVALGGYRTGLTSVATQDDLECCKWIVEHGDDELMIIGGYNGRQVMAAFVPVFTRLIDVVGNAPPTPRRYPDKCYMFFTTWNAENNKYVEPLEAGLRIYYAMPLVYEDVHDTYFDRIEYASGLILIVPRDRYIRAKEVFRSGQAVVYEVDE